MTTRNFPSHILDRLRYSKLGASIDHANITYTLREETAILGSTRWGIIERFVFEAEEMQFYSAVFESGATEMQDYDFLTEYETFECNEVVPQTVTRVEYVSPHEART